jgi:hypothetical protein
MGDQLAGEEGDVIHRRIADGRFCFAFAARGFGLSTLDRLTCSATGGKEVSSQQQSACYRAPMLVFEGATPHNRIGIRCTARLLSHAR